MKKLILLTIGVVVLCSFSKRPQRICSGGGSAVYLLESGRYWYTSPNGASFVSQSEANVICAQINN